MAHVKEQKTDDKGDAQAKIPDLERNVQQLLRVERQIKIKA